MVLSLVNLSLLAIRDHIEGGRIDRVHELPQKWHQVILDFILMHGTIRKESCLRTLTRADFVRGFSCLSTWCGRVNDDKFLDGVSDGIQAGDRNRLSQLAINLYAISGESEVEKFKNTIENFKQSVRLISRCRKLTALHVRFVANATGDTIDARVAANGSLIRFLPLSSATSSTTWKPLDDGGLLNAIAAYGPCLSVLENLSDFVLIAADPSARRVPPLITSHQPLIEFKNLTRLHLVGGTAYFDAWFNFMSSVSCTLEYLHIENVEFHWGRERNACVLPFKMPKLRSLNAHGLLSYVDTVFVKNVGKSTNLNFVSVTLSGLESQENHASLSEMDALKEIRLNFRHGLFGERGTDAIVGGLVHLFDEKITSFLFNGTRTEYLKSACRALIENCEYLATFRLDTVASFVEIDQNFLIPLVRDRSRALRLRDLELHGPMSASVLRMLFENCLDLDSLVIWDCAQLENEHLYLWALNGARPRTLKFVNCNKITDNGLIPILIGCGLRLTHFRFTCAEVEARISEKALNILAESCRNIEWFCCPAQACGAGILAKIRKKSFKCPVKAVLV